MSAVIVDLADAVVDKLNAASLSQLFTAERTYVPVHGLEQLSDLKVSVVPTGLTATTLERSTANLYEYVIDIGIQRGIGRGSMTPAEINAACDPLMLLAQEIVDLFSDKRLSTYTDAFCSDFTNTPIFHPPHIDEHRVFTSVVSLTFKLRR